MRVYLALTVDGQLLLWRAGYGGLNRRCGKNPPRATTPEDKGRCLTSRVGNYIASRLNRLLCIIIHGASGPVLRRDGPAGRCLSDGLYNGADRVRNVHSVSMAKPLPEGIWIAVVVSPSRNNKRIGLSLITTSITMHPDG